VYVFFWAFITESMAGMSAAMRASLEPLSSMMGCDSFASESVSTDAGTAAVVEVAGVPPLVYGAP
jgi:hypothetical protein